MRLAELPLPPQRLQILEQLACTGATGMSLEDLHLKVWGGTEYHPLRHRNAVYVALTRPTRMSTARNWSKSISGGLTPPAAGR